MIKDMSGWLEKYIGLTANLLSALEQDLLSIAESSITFTIARERGLASQYSI